MKTNVMTHNEILAAVKAISPAQDFVWDGVNEDDKPATKEELSRGLALAKQSKHGFNEDKTQILFQVDKAVLQAFRASGQDWQSHSI
jgi:uncharacterized protein (DUF4415 family)